MYLTPNVYKNLKWQVKPESVIDAATVRPISNIVTEDQTIASATATIAKVNNSEVTLPVSPDSGITSSRCVYNRGKQSQNDNILTYAKGRTEYLMGSGVLELHTDKPVQGNPSVQITLRGDTYIVDQDEHTYNTYPSDDDMLAVTETLAPWIVNKGTYKKEVLTHDYSQGVFKANPWIRNLVLVPGDSAGEIITPWVDMINTSSGPLGLIDSQALRVTDWKEIWHNKDDSTITGRGQMNPNPVKIFIGSNEFTGKLQITDVTVRMAAELEKISDYDYKVKWNVPVKFAYIAASRRIVAGSSTQYTVGSYAYLDLITHVDIALVSDTYSDEHIDYTAGKGVDHPFTLDVSEALTIDTYYAKTNGERLVWYTSLAQNLLNQYNKGKYKATCDVPMQWVYDNKIVIGCLLRVKLQDSQPITRKNVEVDFKVVNMTKRYNAKEFSCTLHLLEV